MRIRATLATIALAALLPTACLGCRAASVSVTDAQVQAERVCGLSSRDCALLGDDLGIVLSLGQVGLLSKTDAKRAMAALRERPGAASPTNAGDIDPVLNLVRVGERVFPTPNDHGREARDSSSYSVWCQAAWRPDGPFAIPAAEQAITPRDMSDELGILPNRGACYEIVTAPGTWRLSSVVEIPALFFPEEAGSHQESLAAYAYIGLDGPGVGLDAGLICDAATRQWEAFTWLRSQTQSKWCQGALSRRIDAQSRLLLVLEVTAEADACRLRVYDADDWGLVGWFEVPVPPDAHVTRANKALEFRLVSALATVAGDLPHGARYAGCRWIGTCRAGLCETAFQLMRPRAASPPRCQPDRGTYPGLGRRPR